MLIKPFFIGLSHYTSEDIDIRGYHIPKGTTLEGNIWCVQLLNSTRRPPLILWVSRAILHDPNYYPSPNTFDPSRFLGPSPAPDPRKYIFGFGRRVCPGLHIADNETWIICAGLMALFNIRATANLSKLAKDIGEETWKLFEPFESM